MKAYGIWNTKAGEWLRAEAKLLVYYTTGAAEAERAILGNQPTHEVAEIGDDGLPVEVEQRRVPSQISDEVREQLHDLADDYSRSVKQTCADANYVLPDRILGRVAIDMRLCAEAAYWWGVGVAALKPDDSTEDGT